MSEAHSKIGASSMYRWSACPGSVRQCEGKPSLSSAYAEEGTEAHDLAALWLKKKKRPKFQDEVMLDAVTVYVNYVNARKNEDDEAVVLIEHKFDLSSVHPGCFGTADAVIWHPSLKKLVVIDFKYGAGLFVSAIGNPQLKYYALGALATCGFQAERIEQVIVQPRYEHPEGPIRSCTIDAMDLYDFRVDLKDFAEATEKPDAPLNPGEHCRFCPAAPTCPGLLAKTQAVAKMEFSPALSYDPAKLKLALDTIPAVKAWIKAVDEFAYAEAEAGRTPPGYKLVEKRATRKWRDPEAAEEALKKIGITASALYEPRSIKSPAAMEKDGIREGVWGDLVEKVSSGHTLVPESDKRPAVKLSAKDEFTAIDCVAG